MADRIAGLPILGRAARRDARGDQFPAHRAGCRARAAHDGPAPPDRGASALLFFTQPVAGGAMDICWALVAVMRLRPDIIRIALVAALCHGVLLVPWTLRNERMLGAPIITRSNFGLEFAIANFPGALERGDSFEGWSETGRTLHPNNAPGAQQRVREIGEVRYSRELGTRAWGWAASHPGAFLIGSLRLWMQFFMPPVWATHTADLLWVRILTAWMMSLINGLGLLARHRHGAPRPQGGAAALFHAVRFAALCAGAAGAALYLHSLSPAQLSRRGAAAGGLSVDACGDREAEGAERFRGSRCD